MNNEIDMSEGLETIEVERQQTFAERQTIKERVRTIIEVGRPVLEDSNLVKPDAEITSSDLEKIRNFYAAVAPTPENWPQTGSNWVSE